MIRCDGFIHKYPVFVEAVVAESVVMIKKLLQLKVFNHFVYLYFIYCCCLKPAVYTDDLLMGIFSSWCMLLSLPIMSV